MANKSSLRARKKLILDSVIDTLREADELYFNPSNGDDSEYAAQTINFCKVLLNDMNF